jgi:hypothetical protein
LDSLIRHLAREGDLIADMLDKVEAMTMDKAENANVRFLP